MLIIAKQMRCMLAQVHIYTLFQMFGQPLYMSNGNLKQQCFALHSFSTDVDTDRKLRVFWENMDILQPSIVTETIMFLN